MMNVDVDKAKRELLDAIGNHHRSVVMLLGNNLNSMQLDATEKSIVSAMRGGVDRVASAAYSEGRSKGRELGKQEGLAEARKLTKEEKSDIRRNAFNAGYCAAASVCRENGNSDLKVDEAFEQGKLAVTRMVQELLGVKVNCGAPFGKVSTEEDEQLERFKKIVQDLSEGNLFNAKPFSECVGEYVFSIGDFNCGTLRYHTGEPPKPLTVTHEEAEAKLSDKPVASYGLYADDDMAELEKERSAKRRYKWNSFPLFGAGKDVRFRIGANGSESVVAFHAGVEVGGVLPSGTLCPTCWSGEVRANKARIEAKRIAELDAKANDAVVSRMGPPKMMPNPELFETVFNGKIVTLQNRATRGVMIVADGWVIGSVCHSNGATIVRFVGSVEETIGAGCVAFLTLKILAFSSWQFRYPSANPSFRICMCEVEGKPGYAVTVELDGNFRLVGPYGEIVCSIGKSISGLSFVPTIPHPPEYAVIDAALQTIRRNFYGNMG